MQAPATMSVDERHRAVCAIGGLRPASAVFGQAQPPLLMGSGYCVNGMHRIVCSCAHVWREIPANLLDPNVHGVAIGFRPDDRWIIPFWRKTNIIV